MKFGSGKIPKKKNIKIDAATTEQHLFENADPLPLFVTKKIQIMTLRPHFWTDDVQKNGKGPNPFFRPWKKAALTAKKSCRVKGENDIR